MEQPGRYYAGTPYRYGYQGMEQDTGAAPGDHFTTFFRQYDARLGRWWGIDPVTNPSESPYAAMGNSPIGSVDPSGADTGDVDNNPPGGEHEVGDIWTKPSNGHQYQWRLDREGKGYWSYVAGEVLVRGWWNPFGDALSVGYSAHESNGYAGAFLAPAPNLAPNPNPQISQASAPGPNPWVVLGVAVVSPAAVPNMFVPRKVVDVIASPGASAVLGPFGYAYGALYYTYDAGAVVATTHLAQTGVPVVPQHSDGGYADPNDQLNAHVNVWLTLDGALCSATEALPVKGYMNPQDINFSQRTVSANVLEYAAAMESGERVWNAPIRVMARDGRWVTYDNRRLLAALMADERRIPVEIVQPDGLTFVKGEVASWENAFQIRLNDGRNVRNGGAVPNAGTPNEPIILPKRSR